MKATQHLSVLVVALLAGTLDCGGVTGKNAKTHSDAGADASTPVDASTRAPASHRAKALSCVGVNSPPEPVQNEYGDYTRCARHEDCTEGENGKCISGLGRAGMMYFCVYDECASDADCDPGMVCHCDESTAARCFSIGNCQTDADCGAGEYGYCSPSMSSDCGGYRPLDGYHCHTGADSCIDDSDCTGTDYCNYSEYDDRWKCTPTDQGCVIG